jgi:Truncated hemoglobins
MKSTLYPRLVLSLFVAGAIAGLTGCSASPAKKANTNFFTSGSREADQRASQRMAQAEQLEGSGEGGGEKGVKKAKVKKSDKAEAPSPTGRATTNEAAQATNKLSLYERLGGQAGISNIVADFTKRAMDDPRVNWTRQGVTHGGITLLHKGKSETWNPTPENVEQLKKHMVEFLVLATGGPAQYTGRPIEAAHANMQISNPEFDAAIGDLKASLDVFKIPNKEQKELLSIVESTRPQIVTKR